MVWDGVGVAVAVGGVAAGVVVVGAGVLAAAAVRDAGRVGFRLVRVDLGAVAALVFPVGPVADGTGAAG